MPAKTKRQRELANYTADEAHPQRCRIFRHAFIHTARTLAMAGITSNAELAARFGVSTTAVANWRKQFPEFEQAIQGGHVELVEEMTDVVVRSAREGDITSARYLLDRRAPAFKPSSKTELSGRVEGLADLIARRVSDEALRAQGVLYDEDDEPAPVR
jgi:transposase-like protein